MQADAAFNEMNITVSDTGPGIAEDALPHIFERFYQADPSRKEGSQHGAGLGLSIVQEIISAHGGRITARNHEESGATFTVILPLKRSETITLQKRIN